MPHNRVWSADVVLVGAGIMSTTLAVILKELEPDLSVEIIERLPAEAQESSAAWNNAGTGHAANCELNYTPMSGDGTIDLGKALNVNAEFDMSRQFWSYLVRKGAIEAPDSFIHSVPHMSLVMGEDRANFLKQRYDAMSAHHCFQGMEFSQDHRQIAEWAPLIMEGRDPLEVVTATRMSTGTDVDYGALTTALLNYLKTQDKFAVAFDQEVVNLRRRPHGAGWSLAVRDAKNGALRHITARRVFLGAGGHALTLLQKSHIPEAEQYAGFPVSGIWLKCDSSEVADRHNAKVYGMADDGSPPMSVPHLDTRIIDNKRWLLFGPYAGFSTKFLKKGSLLDLPKTVRPSNIKPMLAVAKDNLPLEEYLVEQVFQSRNDRFDALRKFYPDMQESDWELAVAGQRVQIIKKRGLNSGVLEFGTEIVFSGDSSLFAVLGASPGASTAVWIMIHMLESAFGKEIFDDWVPKITEMIPSFGGSLSTNAQLVDRVRKETAEVLGLTG